MSNAVTPNALPTVRTPAHVRASVSAWRQEGRTVALVPTMGALHEGHISLVKIARQHADRVVASLFVNPTQFAPNEDFDAYPRDEASDMAALKAAGCHLLYAPDASVMYPDGFATQVIVNGPAEGLESAARPHFFHGVGLVVAKLLIQSQPDVAVFGEKDYQQLQVIRRLTRDLDLPVTILSGPTIREADGLAMSSRNAYLSASAREVAGRLNVVLTNAAKAMSAGQAPAAVEADAVQALHEAGFDHVDYVAVRDANTLALLDDGAAKAPVRILAAALIDGVRLIDNISADI